MPVTSGVQDRLAARTTSETPGATTDPAGSMWTHHPTEDESDFADMQNRNPLEEWSNQYAE